MKKDVYTASCAYCTVSYHGLTTEKRQSKLTLETSTNFTHGELDHAVVPLISTTEQRSERQDMQMVFAFAFVFLFTSHPSIKRVNSALSWLLYVTLPDTYHYRWHRATL